MQHQNQSPSESNELYLYARRDTWTRFCLRLYGENTVYEIFHHEKNTVVSKTLGTPEKVHVLHSQKELQKTKKLWATPFVKNESKQVLFSSKNLSWKYLFKSAISAKQIIGEKIYHVSFSSILKYFRMNNASKATKYLRIICIRASLTSFEKF